MLEELSGEQVRLHPLVREFGQRLVTEDGERGTALLQEAGERLVAECTNLKRLEQRALRLGYWQCLEQVRAIREYVTLLNRPGQAEQIGRIERWLDRESYLLGDEQWWPERLPGLFHQQIINCSVEEEYPLPASKASSVPWLQQIGSVKKGNFFLLQSICWTCQLCQ